MGNSVDFLELSGTLKALLKEKKITYRKLAKTLGIFESSVKKLFISSDCTFSRLNAICGALDIELADLLQAARSQPARKFRFTPKQEQFLVENEKSFHIYWKIVYEEFPIGRIKQEFQISDAVLFKHLRALDQQGLLELLPDGEIRHPNMNMVLWENTGAVVKKIRSEWTVALLKKVNEGMGQPGYHLAMRVYQLRPETQLEFIKAMEEVLMEFGRRSMREARLGRKETLPFGVVAAFAPRSFVESL